MIYKINVAEARRTAQRTAEAEEQQKQTRSKNGRTTDKNKKIKNIILSFIQTRGRRNNDGFRHFKRCGNDELKNKK